MKKTEVHAQSFPLLAKLDTGTQVLIAEQSEFYRLSFQQTKQLIDFSVDFEMWDEKRIGEFFQVQYPSGNTAFNTVRSAWDNLKNNPKNYEAFFGSLESQDTQARRIVTNSSKNLGFGHCPVASPKTRCCNLLTLDAVEGCAFDCSYCSIRTFYNHQNIQMDSGFVKKLQTLELDPGETYHIGTGQSSDSLLWGNRNGMLEALFDFASGNPNVILEFKTKSNNIDFILNNPVPKNILFTWSLNTDAVVKNEEHYTASLDNRIAAARKVADTGALVGFHFHPIVVYRGSESDYEAMYRQIIADFQTDEVALVSFGTLTFIKPVIKAIRRRNIRSKILQMPLSRAGGKYSYPLEIKHRIFTHAYNTFQPWHDSVYFYLCMEDASLWMDVFGYEYPDNQAMERSMKTAYMEKINEKRSSHR